MSVYETIRWFNDKQIRTKKPIETALRSANALQQCILDDNVFDCEMHIYDLHRSVASWVNVHYDAIYNIRIADHDRDSFDDTYMLSMLASMQTLASKIVTPYCQQLQWFVTYLYHAVNYFIGPYQLFSVMLPYIYKLRQLRVIDNRYYNSILIHKALDENIHISKFPEYVRNESKKSFIFTAYRCCNIAC